MKSKNFLVLGAITVAIILASIFITGKEQDSVADKTTGKLFLSTLEANIKDITHVEILTGKNKISMAKTGDTWAIEQKRGFPAEVHQLKQLILGLATATIIEKKTKNPQHYSTLGVEDITVTEATSTAVTLKNDSGKILAAVILGKTANRENTLYIRKAGDPQSWLISGAIPANTETAQWLVKNFISIDRKRITSVLINYPDKTQLKIEKNEPTTKNYTLLNISENKQIRNAPTVNNLALGLKALKLEDLLPENEFTFDAKTTTHTIFETFDGITVKVKSMKKDELWYAQFDASFDAAKITAVATKPEPISEPKTEKEKKANAKSAAQAIRSPEEAKMEVAVLNAKFKDLVFIIPSYKAVNFSKTMSDLVKDK